eukprot:1137533-Pelagomonas_calceolata.AAC.1
MSSFTSDGSTELELALRACSRASSSISYMFSWGDRPRPVQNMKHQVVYLKEKSTVDCNTAYRGCEREVFIQIALRLPTGMIILRHEYIEANTGKPDGLCCIMERKFLERRHIGSKSRASPSPEGKREASEGLGMGSIDSPTHTQKDCVESDLSALSCLHSSLFCCSEASKWAPGLLPGWSCAVSYFFMSSHTAEYPM